jgi:hypothetical protein
MVLPARDISFALFSLPCLTQDTRSKCGHSFRPPVCITQRGEDERFERLQNRRVHSCMSCSSAMYYLEVLRILSHDFPCIVWILHILSEIGDKEDGTLAAEKRDY